jgi:deoxycytidylate deaminase
MATTDYVFDWADLAFASKRELKDLSAVFIPAPRVMSVKRFSEIIKKYLPQGNIVLGLAKEAFVQELEDQPQFKMLAAETVQPAIDAINHSPVPHKIYTLRYNQRDLSFILEKCQFKKAVFVNGSWYKALHLRPEYYTLASLRLPYDMVSPFCDETEARAFVRSTRLPLLPTAGDFSDNGMIELAQAAARQSYDYASFQTGAALGRKKGKSYQLIATAHNRIVPYETYAMLHGSEREKHFSPPHDLNYYDTIHFEVAMLILAQQNQLDLKGASLFANVLPCPHCSRLLAATDIAEVVYMEDHSSGYAVQMLEAAGKKVRRVVLPAQPEL